MCVSFQMFSVIIESRVNATAVACLNSFGLSCYKIPYFRSFVLPCLGSGAKENGHLTVLSPPPFLGAAPLSLLGQQDKTQFLAAGTNAGSLACRKCFC